MYWGRRKIVLLELLYGADFTALNYHVFKGISDIAT